MKLTAQIRLNPTQEQAAILLETMETANAACHAISEYAWETQVFTAFKLHRALYHETRQRFPLSAQVVVRCLGKMADTYKADKKKVHTFRKRGAVVYDSRILKYFTDREEVSIWTLSGRERIPYSAGGPHAKMLLAQRGESDLVYRRGMFFGDVRCARGRRGARGRCPGDRPGPRRNSDHERRGLLQRSARRAEAPVVRRAPRRSSIGRNSIGQEASSPDRWKGEAIPCRREPCYQQDPCQESQRHRTRHRSRRPERHTRPDNGSKGSTGKAPPLEFFPASRIPDLQGDLGRCACRLG